MGKPSDKARSARRLGRCERARIKKHRRGKSTSFVPGAGTCTLKAGRKKRAEFHASRSNPFAFGNRFGRASIGEPSIPKAGTETLDGQATGDPVQFRAESI